jgi:hypothetical protein
MKKPYSALLTALVLAGCAGSGPTAEEGYTERYTRTGTNISDRERGGVTTVNVEEFERQRAANSGTLVRDPAKSH